MVLLCVMEIFSFAARFLFITADNGRIMYPTGCSQCCNIVQPNGKFVAKWIIANPLHIEQIAAPTVERNNFVMRKQTPTYTLETKCDLYVRHAAIGAVRAERGNYRFVMSSAGRVIRSCQLSQLIFTFMRRAVWILLPPLNLVFIVCEPRKKKASHVEHAAQRFDKSHNIYIYNSYGCGFNDFYGRNQFAAGDR